MPRRINDPERNRPPPSPEGAPENRGDFNDNANPLWTLYSEKAKDHDEAKIDTLTEGMNGVLLFAGLFAAALTPFIVDRVQTIQVTPVHQIVFYEQQSVEMLKQISAQLSAAFPQASVPPPPPLLPLSSLTATPSRSDRRVNVFWFISLVLSLAAALLATLVQRWSRNHMQIFHRYKHPLKLSRIRQYLHEGVENWHMSAIAEGVPALIHTSLFLFMIGLADFLVHTDVTVGAPTVVCIVLYFIFYAVTTILPVWNPQFPLHSPFSVLLWFLAQGFSFRSYKDRIDGKPKPVNKNMADGQMELALENMPARKDRDQRAISWLVGDLTEDVEMESLASSIPGSFDPEWGTHVWGKRTNEGPIDSNKNKSLAIDDYDLLHPPSHLGKPWNLLKFKDSPTRANFPTSPGLTRSSTTYHLHNLQVKGFPALCKRVGHLFQTCNNPYHFVNKEDKRRTRSRACIEAVALFVFRMKAELHWFGDINTLGQLLRDQGYGRHPRRSMTAASNQSFVANWTGLSTVITGKLLNSERPRVAAQTVLQAIELSEYRAIERARKIDNRFKEVWNRVETLDRGGPERQEDNEHQQWIDHELEQMARISKLISDLRSEVEKATYELPKKFPWNTLKEMTQSVDACDFLLNPIQAQLKYLQSRLSPGQEQGLHEDAQQGAERSGAVVPLHRPMERQLWRFFDIRDGGAVGFTVELYLLSLRDIHSTSTSPSNESHNTFYAGAFDLIISHDDDQPGTVDSIWTQRVILEVICDIAANRGVFVDFTFPNYIENEVVNLLDKVAAGLSDLPDIRFAVEDLQKVKPRGRERRFGFRDRVLKALKRHVQ